MAGHYGTPYPLPYPLTYPNFNPYQAKGWLGTAATVGAVWFFFSNPVAAAVLFMGYSYLRHG